MKIGYIRVSTQEQNLDLQREAMERAGVDRIFEDKVSGTKTERPGLDQAIMVAREGDILCVWRLDRLGRSLKHLIETVKGLQERGVGFQSLTESIDTTTAGGKLIFHIFGALAEFEHDLIRERTLAGLASARARGKKGGRKPITADDRRMQRLKQLIEARTPDGKFMYEIDEIRDMMPINNKPMSRSTYFRLKNLLERSQI